MRRAQELRGWDCRRVPVGAPPEQPKHKSKKDTKRWCAGHIGREHDYQWVVDERFDYAWIISGTRTPADKQWYVLKCSQCGKQKDSCYALGHFNRVCKCGNHKEPAQ
jgi:hypothetical protein